MCNVPLSPLQDSKYVDGSPWLDYLMDLLECDFVLAVGLANIYMYFIKLLLHIYIHVYNSGEYKTCTSYRTTTFSCLTCNMASCQVRRRRSPQACIGYGGFANIPTSTLGFANTSLNDCFTYIHIDVHCISCSNGHHNAPSLLSILGQKALLK